MVDSRTTFIIIYDHIVEDNTWYNKHTFEYVVTFVILKFQVASPILNTLKSYLDSYHVQQQSIDTTLNTIFSAINSKLSCSMLIVKRGVVSSTLNVNATLFIIPCKKKNLGGGIVDLQYCNYRHLPIDLTCKLQSSMPTFVHLFIKGAIQEVTIVTFNTIFSVVFSLLKTHPVYFVTSGRFSSFIGFGCALRTNTKKTCY